MTRSNYYTKLLRIVLMLVVVCLGVWPRNVVHAGPLQEFYALEEELIAAQEAYTEALQALDGDEHGKPKHGVRLPSDPRPGLLKKIDTLADRSIAHKDGAEIAMGAFVWSWNFDLDLDHLRDRFDRLVKHYPDADEPEDALSALPAVVAAGVGKPAAWASSVQRLIDHTKRGRTKLAAMLTVGQVYLAGEDSDKARTAFTGVLKAKDNKDFADLAKGYLFEVDHLQIGMTAPDFSVETLDGKRVSLKSLRGKVVLLDFWAAWCPSCVTEIPYLGAMTKKWKDKPFEVLAISLDYTREDLEALLDKVRFPAIHTWDEAGVDNPVGVLYNVQNLPTSYLIDQTGVIRARDPFGDKLDKALFAIFTPGTTNLGSTR